jgi:hypothetical protein
MAGGIGGMNRKLVMGLLWIAAGIAIAALASAQGRQPSTIITGPDIGFRLDPVQRNRNGVTGTLMLRINGAWVEAQFTTRPVPAMP